MTDLTNLAKKVSPPWLRGKWGSRLLYALTLPLDAMRELVEQGIRARFPLVGTPTALAALGRDRGLRRGPAETNLGFGTRLTRWLDDGHTSGNAWALLDQIAGYFEPTPPLLRYVSTNASGVTLWYTRYPDGTRDRSVVSPGNWDWDGQALRSRGWVLIDVSALGLYPCATYDDGTTYDDGHTVYDGITGPLITDLQSLAEDWTAAHAVLMGIALLREPGLLGPAGTPSTDPDGWTTYPVGNWGSPVDPVTHFATRDPRVDWIYLRG